MAEITPEGQSRLDVVGRIVQCAIRRADEPILDVGTGHGLFAKHLFETGLTNITALDVRPDRVPWTEPWARWHLADARELSRERWGSYACILLLGIMYHLNAEGIARVMRAVHDMLHPGGLAIIDTHVALLSLPAALIHQDTELGLLWGRHYDENGSLLSSAGGETSFWLTPGTWEILLGSLTGFHCVAQHLYPALLAMPKDRHIYLAWKGFAK